MLTSEGRYDEAFVEIKEALRLDPESFEVNSAAARLHVTQRRYAEAINYYEKAAALMETDFSSVSLLMICYKELGDTERARSAAQRTLARAEKITTQEPDNLTMRYNFACGFAQLDEIDVALGLLGPVFERDAAETVNWAKVDPDLNALREHPRFRAMLEKADARLASAGETGALEASQPSP